MIKGGYTCVCFSEAPIPIMPRGLVNAQSYSNYSPFGFLYSKEYVYSLGGRTVIYQPDCDFELLDARIRWRHMRLELGGPQPIDFTWEREWRVQVPEVPVDPAFTHLVFPNRAWYDYFLSEHHGIEMAKVQQYALIFGEQLAQQYYEPCKWCAWLLEQPASPAAP